ncbi:uncharacterized protein LOC143425726 [Xylocopa sonorina]|uniref:uncharacterized protein LOC143425726 n=1 Tax=Xylocopa sonorina TaxID=1818115 RepID=UPI00403AABA5
MMPQICDRESESTNQGNGQESEFGNFQDTYNWVECESTSIPGNVYFYNLRTQCSTWTRPVESHVQLQKFKRNSKIYDNNFTPDTDNLLMIVSSDSEDGKCYEDKEIERTSKNLEILRRLYYTVDINSNDHNDDEYLTDNSNCVVKNIFARNNLSKLTKINNFNEKWIYKSLNSPIMISKFLETELHIPENDSENIEKNEQLISENESIKENYVSYSSSDEEKENDVVENLAVPRLKKIKPNCLLNKTLQYSKKKKNMRKRTLPEKTKLKPKKIICEMYGTKTINYDSIDPLDFRPNLLPGVKTTNLSDSSITSSVRQAADEEPAGFKNFEIPNLNFQLNLSSESSSSSCSSRSCSTCSSSSSDTSSTSSRRSTDTSKKG